MKVERSHVSSSGAGTKVGASKFCESSMPAGGDGRLSRDGSGNSRITSAMAVWRVRIDRDVALGANDHAALGEDLFTRHRIWRLRLPEPCDVPGVAMIE